MKQTILSTTIRILYGKHIRNPQNLIEKHPRSAIFPTLMFLLIPAQFRKPTLTKQKIILRQLRQQERKLPRRKRIHIIMTTISKNTLLLWMSMQINKHSYPILIVQYISLYLVDLSRTIRFRRPPCTVQIVTSNVASWIAKNNTIRIQHRNHLYHIVLKQMVYDVFLLLFDRIDQK